MGFYIFYNLIEYLLAILFPLNGQLLVQWICESLFCTVNDTTQLSVFYPYESDYCLNYLSWMRPHLDLAGSPITSFFYISYWHCYFPSYTVTSSALAIGKYLMLWESLDLLFNQVVFDYIWYSGCICVLRFIFSYYIMPKYMVNKFLYDLVVVSAHFQKKTVLKTMRQIKNLSLVTNIRLLAPWPFNHKNVHSP